MDYEKIEALLTEVTGIDPGSLGTGLMRRSIDARIAASTARNADEYFDRLRTGANEMQQLIEAVVVPETWFFRGREAFDALASVTARDWLTGQSPERLRVLSVPCSTGEEPYSIAMALLDAGLPSDRFLVDAMDISASAISIARRAQYGAHSFRGPDLGFRQVHFQENHGSYKLHAQVRDAVRLRHGNLLALGSLVNEAGYDVVFCRNLLIYFDGPAQQRAFDVLHRLLKRNGTLFVGPAEAVLALEHGFSPLRHRGAFAYRRDAVDAQTLAADLLLTARTARPERPAGATKAASAGKAPRLLRPDSAQAAQASTSPNKSRSDRDTELERAERLADAGQLADAAALCAVCIRGYGGSARAYYLLGLVHDAMGEPEQAQESYRRAIYLQPDHADALAHLALLLEKRGDTARGQRLRMRAQRCRQRADE